MLNNGAATVSVGVLKEFEVEAGIDATTKAMAQFINSCIALKRDRIDRAQLHGHASVALRAAAETP
eukprot:3347846-Prymnesium_polylepis.1